MGIRIREMIDSDWEKVSAIYNERILQGGATFEQECPSYDVWDAGHLEECRYVAVADHEVIGFIAISPVSKREAYHGVVELSVYVDENYEGKGVGSALLSHLCTEAEKLGFWSLFSVIIEGNEASIHLHKKFGFRQIGFREKIARDRNGEWKNTILMEKRSTTIL